MNDLFSVEKPLKERAGEFVEEWKSKLAAVKSKNGEKQLCQTFWIDIADLIAGSHEGLEFEKETSAGGYADVYWQNRGFIVEQKSKGVDLDRPEIRQKEEVTPFQQAKRYRDALPKSEIEGIRNIVTSNFENFRFYNLDTREGLNGHPTAECALEEIPEKLELFEKLFKGERADEEWSILDAEHTEAAADGISRLYESLLKGVREDGDLSERERERYESQIPLIIMRIVFLLFANSTSNSFGVFTRREFESFIKFTDAIHLSMDLISLFRCLNIEGRQARAKARIPLPLRDFPYVDGELFSFKGFDGEEIDYFPQFPASVYGSLEELLSRFKDWDRIDISVFGTIMDQAFKGEYRHEHGIYNTSRENIRKVIDPLFMNGLRDELRKIERIEDYEEKRKKLGQFHSRLSKLQFFDPACGSGAFLIESYMELRDLEDRVIELENPSTHNLDLEVKVAPSQFRGIELNEYAAMIARTSLYIAREQALKRSYARFRASSLPPSFLPLKYEVGGVVCANALEMDWGDLATPSSELYVFGNPPYRGYSNMDDLQKEDLKAVWGQQYYGRFDYCTAWTFKAAKFLNGSGARFAFVTTSSIAQGNQVTPLFEPIFNMGWKISFAYTPFAWDRPGAAVAVVIIGMAQDSTPPYCLWDEGEKIREVGNISQYLNDFPTVFVEEEESPISSLPECCMGGKPVDNGGLILNEFEKAEAEKDPIAAKYILPYFGGEELVAGKDRWCLWITPEIYQRDGLASQVKKSKFLADRLEIVRNYRLKSTKAATVKAASTPYSFQEIVEPTSREYTLAIPEVFTPSRKYFSAGFLGRGVVFSNKLYVIEKSGELAFSIIESSMFKAWQDLVGGRFGMSNNFGNTQVYNTFPLPDITKEQEKRIIDGGAKVLAARSDQKGVSLRDMYNPKFMPLSLQKAHDALDRAVDASFAPFASTKFVTEHDRQTALLKAYRKLISEKKG